MKKIEKISPILLTMLSIAIFSYAMSIHGGWERKWEKESVGIFIFISGPLFCAGFYYGKPQFKPFFLRALYIFCLFSGLFFMSVSGKINDVSYVVGLFLLIASLYYKFFKTIKNGSGE